MKGFRMLFVSVAIGLLSLSTLAQGSASVVKVSPGESVYKIKRGGAVQVEVVIKVGEGYHINSNRPLEKYLIATTLKIDRSPGLTVTPVVYPKAKLEKFEFSKNPLSVFEGKAVLKLTARALSSLAPGAQYLKGKLMVQACNNQQCLRPQSIDVNIPLQVE
ncbi:MAG: protein-disulfide reductase DsbD domain-containing protein [Blastocatellia bacterium]